MSEKYRMDELQGYKTGTLRQLCMKYGVRAKGRKLMIVKLKREMRNFQKNEKMKAGEKKEEGDSSPKKDTKSSEGVTFTGAQKPIFDDWVNLANGYRIYISSRCRARGGCEKLVVFEFNNTLVNPGSPNDNLVYIEPTVPEKFIRDSITSSMVVFAPRKDEERMVRFMKILNPLTIVLVSCPPLKSGRKRGKGRSTSEHEEIEEEEEEEETLEVKDDGKPSEVYEAGTLEIVVRNAFKFLSIEYLQPSRMAYDRSHMSLPQLQEKLKTVRLPRIHQVRVNVIPDLIRTPFSCCFSVDHFMFFKKEAEELGSTFNHFGSSYFRAETLKDLEEEEYRKKFVERKKKKKTRVRRYFCENCDDYHTRNEEVTDSSEDEKEQKKIDGERKKFEEEKMEREKKLENSEEYKKIQAKFGETMSRDEILKKLDEDRKLRVKLGIERTRIREKNRNANRLYTGLRKVFKKSREEEEGEDETTSEDEGEEEEEENKEPKKEEKQEEEDIVIVEDRGDDLMDALKNLEDKLKPSFSFDKNNNNNNDQQQEGEFVFDSLLGPLPPSPFEEEQQQKKKEEKDDVPPEESDFPFLGNVEWSFDVEPQKKEEVQEQQEQEEEEKKKNDDVDNNNNNNDDDTSTAETTTTETTPGFTFSSVTDLFGDDGPEFKFDEDLFQTGVESIPKTEEEQKEQKKEELEPFSFSLEPSTTTTKSTPEVVVEEKGDDDNNKKKKVDDDEGINNNNSNDTLPLFNFGDVTSDVNNNFLEEEKKMMEQKGDDKKKEEPRAENPVFEFDMTSLSVMSDLPSNETVQRIEGEEEVLVSSFGDFSDEVLQPKEEKVEDIESLPPIEENGQSEEKKPKQEEMMMIVHPIAVEPTSTPKIEEEPVVQQQPEKIMKKKKMKDETKIKKRLGRSEEEGEFWEKVGREIVLNLEHIRFIGSERKNVEERKRQEEDELKYDDEEPVPEEVDEIIKADTVQERICFFEEEEESSNMVIGRDRKANHFLKLLRDEIVPKDVLIILPISNPKKEEEIILLKFECHKLLLFQSFYFLERLRWIDDDTHIIVQHSPFQNGLDLYDFNNNNNRKWKPSINETRILMGVIVKSLYIQRFDKLSHLEVMTTRKYFFHLLKMCQFLGLPNLEDCFISHLSFFFFSSLLNLIDDNKNNNNNKKKTVTNNVEISSEIRLFEHFVLRKVSDMSILMDRFVYLLQRSEFYGLEKLKNYVILVMKRNSIMKRWNHVVDISQQQQQKHDEEENNNKIRFQLLTLEDISKELLIEVLQKLTSSEGNKSEKRRLFHDRYFQKRSKWFISQQKKKLLTGEKNEEEEEEEFAFSEFQDYTTSVRQFYHYFDMVDGRGFYPSSTTSSLPELFDVNYRQYSRWMRKYYGTRHDQKQKERTQQMINDMSFYSSIHCVHCGEVHDILNDDEKSRRCREKQHRHQKKEMEKVVDGNDVPVEEEMMKKEGEEEEKVKKISWEDFSAKWDSINVDTPFIELEKEEEEKKKEEEEEKKDSSFQFDSAPQEEEIKIEEELPPPPVELEKKKKEIPVGNSWRRKTKKNKKMKKKKRNNKKKYFFLEEEYNVKGCIRRDYVEVLKDEEKWERLKMEKYPCHLEMYKLIDSKRKQLEAEEKLKKNNNNKVCENNEKEEEEEEFDEEGKYFTDEEVLEGMDELVKHKMDMNCYRLQQKRLNEVREEQKPNFLFRYVNVYSLTDVVVGSDRKLPDTDKNKPEHHHHHQQSFSGRRVVKSDEELEKKSFLTFTQRNFRFRRAQFQKWRSGKLQVMMDLNYGELSTQEEQQEQQQKKKKNKGVVNKWKNQIRYDGNNNNNEDRREFGLERFFRRVYFPFLMDEKIGRDAKVICTDKKVVEFDPWILFNLSATLRKYYFKHENGGYEFGDIHTSEDVFKFLEKRKKKSKKKKKRRRKVFHFKKYGVDSVLLLDILSFVYLGELPFRTNFYDGKGTYDMNLLENRLDVNNNNDSITDQEKEERICEMMWKLYDLKIPFLLEKFLHWVLKTQQDQFNGPERTPSLRIYDTMLRIGGFKFLQKCEEEKKRRILEIQKKKREEGEDEGEIEIKFLEYFKKENESEEEEEEKEQRKEDQQNEAAKKEDKEKKRKNKTMEDFEKEMEFFSSTDSGFPRYRVDNMLERVRQSDMIDFFMDLMAFDEEDNDPVYKNSKHTNNLKKKKKVKRKRKKKKKKQAGGIGTGPKVVLDEEERQLFSKRYGGVNKRGDNELKFLGGRDEAEVAEEEEVVDEETRKKLMMGSEGLSVRTKDRIRMIRSEKLKKKIQKEDKYKFDDYIKEKEEEKEEEKKDGKKERELGSRDLYWRQYFVQRLREKKGEESRINKTSTAQKTDGGGGGGGGFGKAKPSSGFHFKFDRDVPMKFEDDDEEDGLSDESDSESGEEDVIERRSPGSLLTKSDIIDLSESEGSDSEDFDDY